ncbi:hypothetical protein AURDEDRAFT_114352, partial [Auricularia subglabra TFB-10046 SS5]
MLLAVPISPHTTHFDGGTRRAVIVTALAGLLSCLMVSFLLIHIVSVAFVPLCIRTQRGGGQDGERVFLRRQLGVFVVCLFLSDFVQSISGMIQIRWAAHSRIDDGPTCTAQAVTLLAGDLGTCLWNAIVALHTFTTIVLRRSVPKSVVILLVVTGWTAVIIASIIGPLAIHNSTNGPFYGIAGKWCFITDAYADARLWIHYVPILISAFIIFLLYAMVFLALRGNIIADDGGIDLRRRPSSSSVNSDIASAQVTAIAKKMLWSPISYVIIVLPIAIARLISLRGNMNAVPLLGITCLFLSGCVNVTIYTATRRALSPIHWSRSLFSRGVVYPQPSRLAETLSTKSSGSGGQPGTPSFDKTLAARTVWVTREQEYHYEDGVYRPRNHQLDDSDDDRGSGKYTMQLVDEAAEDPSALPRSESVRLPHTDGHKRSTSVSFSDEIKPRSFRR